MKKVLVFVLVISFLMVGIDLRSQPTKVEAETAFPTQPIKVIVPNPPGGGSDIIARTFAKFMPKYLPKGSSMVVENIPGAGTVIGMTELFKAKPDGYTLGLANVAALSIMPAYGNTIYTHDSFQTIAQVSSTSIVLAVKKDAPYKTFDEWLSYVQKNPNKFTYSSGGSGSGGHLAMESFNDAANVKTKSIPFDGAGPAVIALLGGQVDGYVGGAQDVKAQVEAGELRIIANFGTSKEEYFKDVVMTKSRGYETAGKIFFGFIAPKGVPRDVVNILATAVQKAIKDPELLKIFTENGISADYAGPEEYQEIISSTYKMNEKVLKKIGLIK